MSEPKPQIRAAVILAAGQGKRMRSALPKVLHEVAGRPMLARVIAVAREAGCDPIVAVIGHGGEQVRAALAEQPVVWAEQREQREIDERGTHHELDQRDGWLEDAGPVHRGHWRCTRAVRLQEMARPLRRPALRIGCSGWQYRSWKGPFYPATLPQSRWLDYYAEHFDSVEINGTFYQLPERSTFEGWRQRAPRRFLMAVKASRYLTHMKRLKDPDEPIHRLLEHAQHLGSHLGPILYQLPPRWMPDVQKGARDYWRVETEDGRRLWVFAHRKDGAPEWFVHGWFG